MTRKTRLLLAALVGLVAGVATRPHRLRPLLRLWDDARIRIGRRRYGTLLYVTGGMGGWRAVFSGGSVRLHDMPIRWWGRRELHWWAKQRLARPARYYGNGGTIHASGVLDVETYEGQVVSVWFRCQALPFRQNEATQARATEMRRMYAGREAMPIMTGVEVLDEERAPRESWGAVPAYASEGGGL